MEKGEYSRFERCYDGYTIIHHEYLDNSPELQSPCSRKGIHCKVMAFTE